MAAAFIYPGSIEKRYNTKSRTTPKAYLSKGLNGDIVFCDLYQDIISTSPTEWVYPQIERQN